MAAPNPARQLIITFGTLFVVNTFVDLKNPLVVNVLRVCFGVVCAAAYLAWQKVSAGVEAAKDANSAAPVWVPTKPPGGAGIMGMLLGDAATPPPER